MDALAAPGEKLILAPPHWQAMRAHVAALAPEEACGLVGGRRAPGQPGAWQSTAVLPVANVLHSPTRYRMDSQEQWQAFLELENQGWELAAIYHSHPDGPDHPSPTDIAEAYYPETIYLIWYRAATEWRCRAFRIENKQAREVSLLVRADHKQNPLQR